MRRSTGLIDERLRNIPVAAFYNTAAAPTIINNVGVAVVDFATLVLDTHNFVTVGANWKFLPTIPGYYAISSHIQFQITNTWALGERGLLMLYKNAVAVACLDRKDNYTNTNMYMGLGGGGVVVYFDGIVDYIDVRLAQNSGGNLTLQNIADQNWISIFRV